MKSKHRKTSLKAHRRVKGGTIYQRGSKYVAEVSSNGLRTRRTFEDEGAAAAWISDRSTAVKVYGSRMGLLSERQIMDAVEAFGKLDGISLRVTDAVDFWLRHNRPQGGNITTGDAFKLFIDAKQALELRPRALSSLRLRVSAFVAAVGAKKVLTDITTADIDKFLPQFKACNRRGYYAAIRGFLNWCIKKKLLAVNPVFDVELPRFSLPLPEAMTPGQVETILLRTESSEMSAAVALQAFAGVRAGEVLKMQWGKHINLETATLRLDGEVCKTRSARTIAIQDNLKKWLVFCRKQSGPIISAQKYIYAKRQIMASGAVWPANGLRHSFASYRLMQAQDERLVCLELGHTSPEMIRRHYRGLVTPADAAKYFEIVPFTGKAIAFKAG